MKQKIFTIVAAISWIVPVIFTVYNVTTGGMAFWYDPARDMLSAWDNLSKLTLIGSTSGIPGIFYGPYWIWWLSFGELFSKDPRFVLFLTTSLPYLLLFPLIIYLFSKIFTKWVSILLWLLFFFAYQGYMSALWNPNLAPLFFLTIIYLIVTFDEKKKGWKNILQLFFAGILSGLVWNLHISFSVGFVGGIVLYLIIMSFVFVNKQTVLQKGMVALTHVGYFLLGFVVMFWPFILFETRHGFMQTKTLINALSHQGNVVRVVGLSKEDILMNFFGSFGKLLSIPAMFAVGLLVVLLAGFAISFVKGKISLTSLQERLLVILTTVACSVLGVYLTAKNPIWSYHFIGTEVIFLLFLGLILTKIKIAQYILGLWILILFGSQIYSTVNSFSLNPLRIDTLYTKEHITKLIIADVMDQQYSVFAYNSAIYNYDYAYLFKWLGNKTFSYDPGMVQRKGIVYLILPKAKPSILTDFENFHTPDKLYKTTKRWQIPDGTVIIKRYPLSP